LGINFDPVVPSLSWFKFYLESEGDWVIAENFLTLNGISASLHIVRSGNDYKAEGFISGTVQIATVPVWLLATRKPAKAGSSDWQ
jgi:hypothetical protein